MGKKIFFFEMKSNVHFHLDSVSAKLLTISIFDTSEEEEEEKLSFNQKKEKKDFERKRFGWDLIEKDEAGHKRRSRLKDRDLDRAEEDGSVNGRNFGVIPDLEQLFFLGLVEGGIEPTFAR